MTEFNAHQTSFVFKMRILDGSLLNKTKTLLMLCDFYVSRGIKKILEGNILVDLFKIVLKVRSKPAKQIKGTKLFLCSVV